MFSDLFRISSRNINFKVLFNTEGRGIDLWARIYLGVQLIAVVDYVIKVRLQAKVSVENILEIDNKILQVSVIGVKMFVDLL